mgnify:FL=1
MPNPKGFGVLADAPAANASLDQTVQKKKFRDRQDIKETSMNTNHCAYESQHEPKNIKVQGLRGRWDVCLHAVEKNGTREYWWVLNADGVDGEEGYWTTRKAKGEYKYFCDAGWGDADNAITHLEEELAD